LKRVKIEIFLFFILSLFSYTGRNNNETKEAYCNPVLLKFREKKNPNYYIVIIVEVIIVVIKSRELEWWERG